MHPGVEVDYRDWMALAVRIIDRPESVTEVDLTVLRPKGELLPGWYDDWILLERERVRQVQLHVLEAAAEQLLLQGRPASALEFALSALGMEQTRESAHQLAIRVHLAEGNVGEAWRQFRRCERVLGTELGIRPSRQLQALVADRAEAHGQPLAPGIAPARPPSGGMSSAAAERRRPPDQTRE